MSTYLLLSLLVTMLSSKYLMFAQNRFCKGWTLWKIKWMLCVGVSICNFEWSQVSVWPCTDLCLWFPSGLELYRVHIAISEWVYFSVWS